MATQSNDSTSLTLEEEGGGVLTLTKRALPYMPLAISGKQRAEFNWYPGNPQATVQMLGPEEQTITLKGFWKDKFIQGTDSANWRAAGSVAEETFMGFSVAPGESVPDVASLVNIVDNMRRMGRRITLTWGDIVRYGHIVGFTQTWQTVHYCEWELEFAVISLEEPQIQASTPNGPSLGDAANVAQGWSKELEPRTVAPPPFPMSWIQSFYKGLNDLDNAIFKYSNIAANGVQLATQAVQAGPNAVRQIMTAMSGAIGSVSTALGTLVDTSMTEWFAIGSAYNAITGTNPVTGDTNAYREDTLPYGMQLGAASYQRSLRTAYLQVRTSAAVLRNQYQQQLQDELKQSFIAKEGMDLRDVSLKYYGTSDYWHDLLDFNGFTSSRLEAGQLVLVPQQPGSAGAGLTQGGRA